jgi:hypothetical protein
MQLCRRCRIKEASIHFSHSVGDREVVDAQLCQECAGPLLARQEASRQGPHACAFCGKDAFSALPGVRGLTHACCGCRSQYRQIFFELCADERPDLLHRSEGEISFFDMCFDPEIESWADHTGNKAIQVLVRFRVQQACDSKT